MIGVLATFSVAEMKDAETGEELFREHCALCHPDGNNIIYPSKSLRKADLLANKITTISDIVKQMRHPGEGMVAWSETRLPDSDALKIADYIMKTFGQAETERAETGEELFKKHCALCHPDGNNIIYPSKSLRKADLLANKIITISDIVKQMRHPGEGMVAWSETRLPDRDALKIADYIMKTYK